MDEPLTADAVWAQPLHPDQIEDLEAWRADLESGRRVSVAERRAFDDAQYATDRAAAERFDQELAEGCGWTMPALQADDNVDEV